MKNSTKLIRLALAFTLLVSVSLQSCLEDKCNMEFSHAVYEPVYMTQEAFENAVEVLPAQELVNPGKIYVKDNYLFVNEVGKGLHIMDYKNPESPENLAFLRVPGNFDIAVNCDKLYLDSSMDLLVFSLNNPTQPRLVNRVKNALPHILEYRGYVADPNEGVVVLWEQKMITEAYDCKQGIPTLWQQNAVTPEDVAQLGNNSRGINPATAGVAGSMSRFSLNNDHLYIVSPNDLYVFDAQSCEEPTNVARITLDGRAGIAEMVTATQDLILIGGTAGMSIYDGSTPDNPTYMNTYDHMDACDPVILDNNVAYLTLRNGSDERCGANFSNQLDVIDMTSPANPSLLTSFAMTNPHGLSKDGDLLFIADGSAGLRVFDASSPVMAGKRPVAHFPEMDGYDVIAYENVLFLVGDDGISLYDYSEPKSITQLSEIPVVR